MVTVQNGITGVPLYFLQCKTNMNHQDKQREAAGACLSVWVKRPRIHFYSVASKKSLFVSGEFLLRYRAVQPPPPSTMLTEWGIVERYGINCLYQVVTPGHKSGLLTASTLPCTTHKDQGWQIPTSPMEGTHLVQVGVHVCVGGG